ncbi:MAG TPA: hypothetical protein VF852_05905, partial [Pseudolabrys sp.]
MIAANATFALKAGEWFRRGLLVIAAPDSRAPACPLSGRNSTYRTVRNCGAASKIVYPLDEVLLLCLLAVLAGAETFTDIALFGEKKLS